MNPVIEKMLAPVPHEVYECSWCINQAVTWADGHNYEVCMDCLHRMRREQWTNEDRRVAILKKRDKVGSAPRSRAVSAEIRTASALEAICATLKEILAKMETKP